MAAARDDLSDIFGKGAHGDMGPDSHEEPDGDEYKDDDEEVPPEFETAFNEFDQAEDPKDRMMALYRCIEACHSSGGKGPGLAVVIGSGPKSKK